MPKVVLLRPVQKRPSFQVPPASRYSPQNSFGMTVCYPDTVNDDDACNINELESEVMKLLDCCGLSVPVQTTLSSQESTERFSDAKISALGSLNEIVVFSPEIQRQGFAESSAGDKESVPPSWGDVFVRVGEEYPFLFTVYTKVYAQNQRIRHGEEILPSSRDILLERHQLDCRDIIRAVIKWVHLYCPSLKGRPISLESESVLQTLVCDPSVEIRCPDAIF